MFQQQQALMNAAAQGAYISPVTLANGQLSQVNGLSNGSVTPTTGKYSGIFAFYDDSSSLEPIEANECHVLITFFK